jgi:deoxyribose-phosphate aldolase
MKDKMTTADLARRIDLTLLKPTATARDVEELIRKAAAHPFATLFIAPCHVRLAAKLLRGSQTKVGAPIGYPLGFATSFTKAAEAKDAFANGAAELDMVMNLALFKAGDFKGVEADVRAVREAAPDAVLKLIIETCYLDFAEMEGAVEIAVGAGADFVKTSTGLGPAGARVEDVGLLYEKARGRIKVKASGGVSTLDAAVQMMEAGAERVGTSSGLAMVEELLKKR